MDEQLREVWIHELQERLWFLPDVGPTVRQVLAGALPAGQVAVRWREDLPRAFAEDIVDDSLVELMFQELINPILTRLPAVFPRAQAEAAMTQLLDASVQDVADRFCQVNEVAVGRLAAGLGELSRGEETGEGQLSEGLASVLSDREQLVRELDGTPELDQVTRHLEEAARQLEADRSA